MDKNFDIVLLDDAFEFLSGLDKKHYEKILFNIRKAQIDRDPELFKKLKDETSHINNFGTHQDDYHGEIHVAIKKQIINT